MAITLNDFGYAKMKGSDAPASGERPALIILANLLGANKELAHSAQYYTEQLFGSPFAFNQNGPYYRKNVRDYYWEMSCGRFTWRPTEPAVVGPLTLSTADAMLALSKRRPRIVELVRDGGLFDFRPYNLSRDCYINGGELGVLIIDNGSNSGAQTDAGAPALSLGCTSAVTGSMGITEEGQRCALNRMAHELCHQLGATDVYGPWNLSLNLSGQCSLMSGSDGDDGTNTFHLDPWHKMRLGWAEPPIFDISGSVPTIDLVAPGAQDPTGAGILFSPSKGTHEFFIIEFRNPTQISGRYDTEVASRGIAIWHVVTDAKFKPLEYQWPTNPDGTPGKGRMLWVEGVPPAAGVKPYFGLTDGDFQRGGNILWDRGTMTPPLRWADGTSTGVRLRVRDFGDRSDMASVDVVADALRRQSSSGRLIQSTWGTTGNYELLVTNGSSLDHFWRNNDLPTYPWHRAGVMRFTGTSSGPIAAVAQTVRGATLLQSTICGDGAIGNFEAVIWLEAPDGTSHLSLSTFDSSRRSWSPATPIIVNGASINGVTGVPALIQSDFGDYGNYELLVPQGNAIVHYWRANDRPGRPWSRGASITFTPSADGAHSIVQYPIGVTVLQSTIKGDGCTETTKQLHWCGRHFHWAMGRTRI
jgi:M6 family metalloprotease-like protein